MRKTQKTIRIVCLVLLFLWMIPVIFCVIKGLTYLSPGKEPLETWLTYFFLALIASISVMGMISSGLLALSLRGSFVDGNGNKQKLKLITLIVCATEKLLFVILLIVSFSIRVLNQHFGREVARAILLTVLYSVGIFAILGAAFLIAQLVIFRRRKSTDSRNIVSA